MKYSEGKVSRVFVIRLEDKDKLPETIEKFASQENVIRGLCLLVGGIRSGGKIVVGPEKSEEIPVNPMSLSLEGVHEIVAAGMVFPDESGRPKLHMHAALGRAGKTVTGCIRLGIETWKVAEIILLEITGSAASRRKDSVTGFDLLQP